MAPTRLRTGASGCGSSGEWQTPTAQLERGGTATRSDGTLLLTGQVRATWQTPSQADGLGGHVTRGGARSGELLLAGQAKQNWPTPSALNRNENEPIEEWAARREAVRLSSGNGNGFGIQLAKAVQLDAVRPDRAKAGNWPTPREAEHKGCGPRGCKAQIHRLERGYLDATVEEYEGRVWATPTTTEAKSDTLQDRAARGHQVMLCHEVRAWPTPASDTGSGGPHGLDGGTGARAMLGADKPVGALNPDWVECLMGWPIGWTRREPLTELVWPAVNGAWPDGPEPGLNWPTPSAVERDAASKEYRSPNNAYFADGRKCQPTLTGAVVRWPAPPGSAQHPWEPPRVGVGIKDRAKRLKAIGNGQCPMTVVLAWRVLTEVA